MTMGCKSTTGPNRRTCRPLWVGSEVAPTSSMAGAKS